MIAAMVFIKCDDNQNESFRNSTFPTIHGTDYLDWHSYPLK